MNIQNSKKRNNRPDEITLIDSEEKQTKPEENYRKAYHRVSFYKDLLAHDINNILQNINSSSELITNYSKDPSKSDKINELNEIIREQVIRGKNLVANIRKLSLLEKTDLTLTKKDVHEVLKQAIEYVLNRFQTHQIKFKVEISDQNHIINADEFLIDVFENILINTVLHNQNPIVEIIIKISKLLVNGLNYIKIEFIDNGIGIPDKMKKLIFQKSKNYLNSQKGMGLGLSLVKSIVESYNGKIWVENKIQKAYSKGSNFIILIPEAI